MEISQYLVIASCAAVLIGMSKGGLPLVGMMSVPLLSLVMSPLKAVVLLLPLYVISDVVGVWLYRRNFSVINLKILVPASMVGILIAWFTASMISDLTIKLIIGLVGVSFCLQTWFKQGQVDGALPASVPKGAFWGLFLALQVSLPMREALLFRFLYCPKSYPKQSLPGRPPFCLPSSIWPKSALIKTSVLTVWMI